MDGTESGKKPRPPPALPPPSPQTVPRSFPPCTGTKPTVLRRAFTIRTPATRSTRSVAHVRADAPLETTTSAASCTAWRGAQTPITSLRHTVATTRVCTTGSQTLTKTTTATTPRTKATASSTPSPPTGHSGTTPTPTAMVITLLQPTNPMLVRPHLAPQQKTASAVPTPTVTAGPTQAIGTHSIPTSGWMQTRTGTATTTCLTLTNISIT